MFRSFKRSWTACPACDDDDDDMFGSSDSSEADMAASLTLIGNDISESMAEGKAGAMPDREVLLPSDK